MILRRGKDPNTEMHFLDHLEALRWHLVRSCIAIVALTGFAFFNKEFLFDTVVLGCKDPDFLTYRVMCNLGEKFNIDMCISELPFTLININLSGQFTTHIYVAFIAGLVLGFPYLLWELWRFIKPALKPNERRFSNGIVFFSSILFLLGVGFGYYIIAPLSINFLGTYQVSTLVLNQISLDSFISTVTTLTLATGIVFELPIVIYFLSRVGIVTPAFLRKYRRHSMVIILIVAAFITPSPDISSQILVALPLFGLYEISIFVSRMVQKNKVNAAG